MPRVYVPRDLFNEFQADALGQHATLLKEDMQRDREPPKPPPFEPFQTEPTPEPPGVPGLEQFMAMAGLQNPPPSGGAAPVASNAGAAPSDSPPGLGDFLNMAGLGDMAGSAMSAVGTAARGATEAVGAAAPPPLQDFLRTAGVTPPAEQPVLNAAPTAASAAPGGGFDPSHMEAGVSQFEIGLSPGDAIAACGPAAAMAFAKKYGRNPTGTEALELARSVGWTPGQGMAGVQSEKALLDKMGVASRLESTIDWNHVTQDALNGNPVIVDTPGHYFIVDGARQNEQGQVEYHVGKSGTALRTGSEWMTRQQIDQHPVSAGAARSALYADNPESPHPSVANTSKSATPTTAGISGGGDLSGKIGEAGQRIMSGGAQAAAWLGDQGQKALQAVLVTEGGMGGARGDNGRSAGPLQFFEGGQLATFARAMGQTLEQAKTYVEQHPLEAVQWAIGTPDKPGYLGAAIQRGIQQGLQGADLATFAQRTGQVSDSPERAGQNYQAMFGGGGALVSDASGGAPAGPDYADLVRRGANLAAQGEALGRYEEQPAESPTAALERDTDQRMAALERTIGSTLQQNQAAGEQRSVAAAEQAGQRAEQQVTATAPEQEQERPLWQKLGEGIMSGLQQAFGGQPQAATPALAAPGMGFEVPRAPAIAPTEGVPPRQDVRDLGQQPQPTVIPNLGIQSPELGTVPGGPLGVAAGTAASALGTVAHGASEALRQVSPVSGASRTVAGTSQYAQEFAARGGPALEAELQDLQQRRLAGDDSVLLRIRGIGAELNRINTEISAGQPYEEAVSQAAERNPEFPAIEAGANIAAGVAAVPLAAEGAPLAFRAIAEVLQPGTNPTEVLRGARDLVRGADQYGPETTYAVRNAWESFGLRWADSTAERERLLEQIGNPRGLLERARDLLTSSQRAAANLNAGARRVDEIAASDDVGRRLEQVASTPPPPQEIQAAADTLTDLQQGGRVVGVPAQAQTADGLAGLRQQLRAMMDAGASQKDWYTDSSQAILSLAQGDRVEAERLAQLVAIYSPNTKVSDNMDHALTAWYQWKAGKPIDAPTLGANNERARKLLEDGVQWEGRKTNNFYRNLMMHIDEDVFRKMGNEAVNGVKQTGVTADIWMMRAFGYKATEATTREFLKAPSQRQYDFIQDEVTRLANERGWRPDQAQAAIWSAIKAQSEGSAVEAAGYHYGTAIAERTAQVSWEASPGTAASQQIPGYLTAPAHEQAAFHRASAEALLDGQGRNIVAREMGVLGGDMLDAPGLYERLSRPGGQTQIAVPRARKTRAGVEIPGAALGRVEDQSRDAISAVAAAHGLLYKQDAAPWTRIFLPPNKTATLADVNAGLATARGEKIADVAQSNAVVVDIGRVLEPGEIVQLDQALRQATGSDAHAIVSTPRGAWVLNDPAHLAEAREPVIPNAQFQNHVDHAGSTLQSVDEVRTAPARFDSEYVSNTWSTAPNGESYTSLIERSGKLDDFRRVEALVAPRIRAAQERIAAQFGWAERGAAGAEPAAAGGGRAGGAAPIGGRLPIAGAVAGGNAAPPAAGRQVAAGLPTAPPRLGVAAGRALPEFTTTLGSAAGGGIAGYQTAPEEATPQERLARGAVGALAGGVVGGALSRRLPVIQGAAEEAGAAEHGGLLGRQSARANLNVGARAPVADRDFDLGRLAQMRADDARAARAGPPAPPPGSKERLDWLQSKGKWAPPEAAKATKTETYVAVTTANMLSGIGTAVQNTIGGIAQNAWRPLVAIASGDVTDAARDVAAMMAGMGEHFSRYGRTFKTGERFEQRYQSTLPGGIAAPLSVPLRNLAATDEFMRSAASTGAQAAEVSYLMRKNPKLSFEEVVDKYHGRLTDVGAQAQKEATFETGGGFMGTLGEKMASWRTTLLKSDNPAEKALGYGMQWAVPMTRVPGVILGKGIRSLPVVNEVAGVVDIAKAIRAGDERAARQAWAKLYLTSFANMAILGEVAQGNITGNGPDNPSDRARLMEAVDADGNPQWRPNSMRIAGRWFDHSALGPISFSMSSIANLVDEATDYAQAPPEKRGEIPQLALDLGKRQVQSVSQAWYLRNLSDLLGAIKEGRIEAIGQQIVTGGDRLIPAGGLLNEIRRLEDPLAREAGTPIERELNRLPFASRTVPPRLSATTGQAIEQPRDILSTVIRGSAGGMTPNPVATEVSRLTEGGNRVSVPREDEMFKGARQTREQTRLIQEQTGLAVNMYVLDTIGKPAYARLTDRQKADALQAAVDQAKEAANVTLGGQVARDPHESALLQYAQKPHYYGISSKLPPEEIARKNWEVDQARAKMTAYRKQYGDAAEDRLMRDDKAAYNLAFKYEPIEKETIDALKAKVDKATGGALSQKAKQAETGGLVGVGSTVLAPPRR